MILNAALNAQSIKFQHPKYGYRTLVEYFAGIGLFRMALEPLGWKTVFANDISETKRDMYQGFFGDAESHYLIGDIFKINPNSLPNAFLATAGFPCIDLSLAGNRSGVVDGKHSSAFWGLIRIFQRQGRNAPTFLILENVPGWLSSNNGDDFRLTIKALNSVGYSCDVIVLDARRFTPQSRQRVFLICNRISKSTWMPFILEQRSKKLKTKRLVDSIFTNMDLSWHFIDIPEPPDIKHEGLNEIIEEMDVDDERWWSDKEVSRHLEMMDQSHRDRVESLRNNTSISYRTFYRRRRNGQQRSEVRIGETAGCLRTAVGGSSKQFIIAAGQGTLRMRNMTSREYARLQGVPDEYEIAVSENAALTGFGDAVCVPAVKWIGENVLEMLVKQALFEVEGPIKNFA